MSAFDFDANVDSREAYTADEQAIFEALADLATMETIEAIEDGECDIDADWIDPSGGYEPDFDGQPDEMQEWEGLADAGYGTDEDYGYYGGEDW